jgi:hypothetical protein
MSLLPDGGGAQGSITHYAGAEPTVYEDQYALEGVFKAALGRACRAKGSADPASGNRALDQFPTEATAASLARARRRATRALAARFEGKTTPGAIHKSNRISGPRSASTGCVTRWR